MANDAFVSFFVGIAVGLILGVVLSAVLAAIRTNEERREAEYRRYYNERNDK